MKDFNRGGSGDRRGGGGSSDRRGGGGSFGRRDGGRDFGRGGSDRPEMHKATCADCGSSCEVPFKPMSGKPVFCSNCFKGKDGGDRSDSRRPDSRDSRGGGRDSFRDSFAEKQMFQATCAECGDDCEVPFRPTAGKTVLCSNCFSKVDPRNDERKEDRRNSAPKAPSSEQFEMLNAKLDQILKALNTTTVKPVVKKEVVKEEKIVEPKKVVKKVAAKKVVAEKKVVKKVTKKK